ncbi:uncharacterized protein [Rutidosis leptorrhynchoides]|uniref:uncharacterized protein n=1 Tax=Rutidosis leptorrhynchoides TaxID=125765 RepID=UPI003A9A0EA2
MNLLSLNIGGGVTSFNKHRWVSKLCKDHAITILGIQETKMSTLNHFAVKALWGNFNFKVAASCARGRSGGILTICDPNSFNCSRVISFNNMQIVEGRFCERDSPCFLINVYAPQSRRQKKRIWDFILSFINNNDGDFIIFGDFNSVRYSHERFGTHFNHLEAADFNDFIANGGLIDIPLGGRAFTRVNKSFTQRSKIDRFMVSNGILDVFPHVTGKILSNLWSDHCPILLCNDIVDYGPTPFKIFHSWFDLENFDKTVEDAWNDLSQRASSNPQIRFKDKLKHVKAALKSWSKDIRSSSNRNKIELTKKIADIDAQLDSDSDYSSLATSRSCALKDLAIIEQMEAANMAQKNKRLIHGMGDENSTFSYKS